MIGREEVSGGDAEVEEGAGAGADETRGAGTGAGSGAVETWAKGGAVALLLWVGISSMFSTISCLSSAASMLEVPDESLSNVNLNICGVEYPSPCLVTVLNLYETHS